MSDKTNITKDVKTDAKTASKVGDDPGPFWKLSSRGKLFGSIAIVIVVLDQISKYWAVAALTRLFRAPLGVGDLGFGEQLTLFLWHKHPVPGPVIPVIDAFWDFHYVENPGAAWGFLSGAAAWFRTPFFLIVSAGAMVFILAYFHRTKVEQWLLRLALALVFGGAIGNFIDRVRLGYVIDFIRWHWYHEAHFPTFNVADAAISVGVALMIVDMIFFAPDEEEPVVKSKTAKSNTSTFESDS